MKYGVYTIQDTMMLYNAPFVMYSDEIAKREFANNMTRNPNRAYMRLWKIGEFDEETGTIIPGEAQLLIKGVDLGEKEE